MKFILFYHRDTLGFGLDLSQKICHHCSGVGVDVFNTMKSFRDHMEKTLKVFENEIYVLLADSKRRLLELTQLNDLMEDKKMILIVPDQSEEVMRLAMRLAPRYIARISDNYEELYLVLDKMAGACQKE